MGLYHAVWLIVVVSAIVYTALIIWFVIGWNATPVFKPQRKVLATKVSVIVPFYNEIEHIYTTLDTLVHQQIQTTEYELIFVDDFSTDGSAEVVQNQAKKYRRVSYILNSGKGKKAALETGINAATGELIVITDADCNYTSHWLHAMVEFFEAKDPSMIIGPVIFDNAKSWFQKFQQLEFVSLVGAGAGAAGINHAIMCNGANLAFKRAVYKTFDDPLKREYISGDDVFLLHHFKQSAEKIEFLKCDAAIVKTKPAKNLYKFIEQRIRWTSKTSGYTDADTLFVAAVVFIITLLLFFCIVCIPIVADCWKPLVFLCGLKTVVDTFFFYRIAHFFKIKALIKFTVFFQLIYAIYVPLIALLTLFKLRQFRE